MTGATTTRSFYLSDAPDPVFAALTSAVGGPPADAGVLFVPPFGWDNVCSYRSRRAWAHQLADGGRPALRIDLPGGGDSAGGPTDPHRVAAWTAAIAAGAAYLRASTGCARVATIGIGLGGLLTVAALAEGAQIDDLVLWATPARGRAVVREFRAFAQLEDAAHAHPDAASPLPAGALAAAGFVLSAQTIADLEALDCTELPLGSDGGRRALLLERDGIAVDRRLRDHLEAQGLAVTVAPGPGYNAMMAKPHDAQPPTEVFAEVARWLAAPSGAGDPPAGAAPRAAAERELLELEISGVRITETPLVIDQPFGRLSGVLAAPAGGGNAVICAVLLNAGAIRRIGPNRMWVEAARRWAALGVPTLRIDLEGIGDSDGDGDRLTDVGELYVPELVEQTLAILDALAERGLPPRFVLGGLCSGAYWSFHAAVRDERVRAALLVNPRALVWDPRIEVAREARKLRKAGSAQQWSRALRGQARPGWAGRLLRALATRALRAPADALERRRRERERRAGADELDRCLDRLRDSDTGVLLAFTGDEPLREELEREGRFDGAATRWPNLRLEFVSPPPETHTLRPLWLQQRVHALLDETLAAELDRCAGSREATRADTSGGYSQR